MRVPYLGVGGNRLVGNLTFTSSDMKLDATDASAMCFDANASPQDLSAYAGGAAALYLLAFYSGTGGTTLVANAYAGAVGGGETLDSELVTNGHMETGDPPSNWDANGGATLSAVEDERDGGAGSKSLNGVRGASATAAYQIIAVATGALYKMAGWVKNGDATSISYTMTGHLTDIQDVVATGLTSWVNGTKYGTAIGTLAQANCIVLGGSGKYGRFDDLSLKKLTDVPATGLKLYKDKALTTRGVNNLAITTINAITTVRIYRVL